MTLPFDPPPGQAGPLSTAAVRLEQVVAAMRKQQQAVKTGGATSLQQWNGKRSDDFAHAIGGLQIEVQLAVTTLDAVATVLAGYARKISSALETVDQDKRSFDRLDTAHRTAVLGGPDVQGPVALTPQETGLQNDALDAKSTLRAHAQAAAREIEAQTNALVPHSSGLSAAELRRRVDGRMGVRGAFSGIGPISQSSAWQMVKSAQGVVPPGDVNEDGSVEWNELYEQVRNYGVDLPASAVALGVTPNALWAFRSLIQATHSASEYVTGAKIASADVVAELARLADSGVIDEATASTVEYLAKGALALGYVTGPGNKLTEAIPEAAAGGIPETGAWGAFGRVAGVLGIVGDVATLIDPGDVGKGESAFLRATAGVNLSATVVVLAGDGTVTAVAGALGIEAATVGWVPVAGQAVLIATGVVLAGDYLYHHWKPAKVVIDAAWHGIDGAYHGVVHAGAATVHGLETAGSTTVHGLEHAGSAVYHFFKSPF